MRHTVTSLLVLLVLGACSNASLAAGSETATPHAPFPEAWIGSWQGEVTMHGPEGERMRFDMLREIAATEDSDRYTWTTTYSGDSGTQVREYTLLVRDRASGAYAIDEHNGIVLDARFLDDTLFSCFEVQSTRLFVRERLVQHDGAPALSFEIATSQGEGVTTGAEIPVVNYPTTGFQRAILRRLDT